MKLQVKPRVNLSADFALIGRWLPVRVIAHIQSWQGSWSFRPRLALFRDDGDTLHCIA